MSAGVARRDPVVLLLLLAVAVYAGGFLLWYGATPLGMRPVLDGREMLALAQSMAAGSLPAEPFYRAPLYPAVLAGLLQLGLPERDLVFAMRALNFVCHLASTALVWSCAQQLWHRRGAGLLAAALFGFNPVCLHFAGDPLDITLAITLMLTGLRAALIMNWRGQAAASALFALAALARPHMLAVLAAYGCARVVAWRGNERRGDLLAAATVPALVVLFAIGVLNLQRADRFVVLPTQGVFNLWAANHRGANGRYFEQQRRIAQYDDNTNPARVEALQRYREAVPGGPEDIVSMNHYWRDALVEEIAAAPLDWARLLAFKAYYLWHNFEQYNNKTYVVHKRRSPWLAPNPVGWSVVLACGLVGFLCVRRMPGSGLLAALIGAYAAALLLTYVSARFRLPLVPLLAILGGGLFASSRLSPSPRSLVLVAVLVAFSLWPPRPGDVERTFVQDDLLMARAALESGEFDMARGHAAEALMRMPRHEAAREIDCVARYNAWLRRPEDKPALALIDAACRPLATQAPPAQRIVAHVDWLRGRDGAALAAWQALAARPGPERSQAVAALIMVDGIKLDRGRPCVLDGCEAPVLLALAARGDGAARESLVDQAGEDAVERASALLVRAYRR